MASEEEPVPASPSETASSVRSTDARSVDPASDEAYFARRAAQELELAANASDVAVKRLHLDLAARYATRRELAARDVESSHPIGRT